MGPRSASIKRSRDVPSDRTSDYTRVRDSSTPARSVSEGLADISGLTCCRFTHLLQRMRRTISHAVEAMTKAMPSRVLGLKDRCKKTTSNAIAKTI